MCPLCVELFESLDDLSLEHAPPKYLGGKAICLTCVPCNSRSGHVLEGPLHLEHRFRRFMYKDGRAERARLSVGGVSINVDVSRSKKGIDIVVPPGQNSPADVSESQALIEEAFREKSTLKLTKTMRFKRCAADAAYLKAGYLGAFAKFGYRWIFSEHLNEVRNQILEPLQDHLSNYRVYLQADEVPWQRGLFLVNRPVPCLLAKIDNSAVLLPWIKGDGAEVFEWLTEQKRKDRPFVCTFKDGWEWPVSMELLIDQIPANAP